MTTPLIFPLRLVDCVPTGARYEGRQVIDVHGQHVPLEELVSVINRLAAAEQAARYGTDPTWPPRD